MRKEARHMLFGIEPARSSFKGLWLLAGLYIGSLMAAAIISPIVFRLVHHFDPETTSYIANKPFADYFDRARLLFVITLFPFLFKLCKMNSWEKLGLARNGIGHTGKWFAYGLLMMAIVYGLDFATSILAVKPNIAGSDIARRLLASLIGAFLIGLIEETLFRGLVFRIFYTAFNPVVAILLSSIFFAALHFKMSDEALAGIPIEAIGIDDGFFAAGRTMTAIIFDFNGLLLLNLTLVGILLHQAFILTKSLWASIGLHAGWVTMVLTISKTFDETERATAFTGTERVVDGYWVTIVLTFFLALYSWKIARTPNDSGERT